jgi:uncharacterized protein (DUF1501 family)
MERMTRRRFLRAAAAGGLLYAFGRTPGTVTAHAAGLGGFADYKALVCVFLVGGNDSWSMVVPRSDAEYAAYAASRRNLAIARDALLPIVPSGGGDFGMHPTMAGLANLFQSGQCAAVANLGPLIQPLTREQYVAKSGLIPPQLFSHNDQQTQWHTLRGRNTSRTGWAGRVADTLASQVPGQTLPLNVSLAGTTVCQAGTTAVPYVLGEAGPQSFKAFGGSAPQLARRAALERLLAAGQDSVYERGYAEVHERAITQASVVNAALAGAPALTTPFPANSTLATQLRTVARMISVRQQLGMSRQIFFVATGGFDTHSGQLEDQPGLLGNLSASLSAFHAATVELGVASSVTTFTQSDFGRSLTSNGNGSDHAWGGVQLVLGDSVNGRAIYGDYPVLQIGGVRDIGGGRLIPEISSDQYVATLARWFGVADAQLGAVAPSIGNFPVRDLGFMASGGA